MPPSLSRLLALPALALLVTAPLAAETGPAEWPHLRGPDHSSATVADGAWLQGWETLTPLWEKEVGIGCAGTIVVADRAITLGNTDGVETVFALDPATGAEIWTHAYDEPLGARSYKGGPNTTPTAHEGRIYWMSREGNAFCCAVADGAVIWNRQIQVEHALNPPRWGFTGSPLIADGRVVFNAGDAGLALDPADGHTLWGGAGGGAGYACPVAQGDDQILLFTARGLVAVGSADGAVRWEQEWRTEWDVNAAAPLVLPQGILITSGYKTGTGLIATDGSARLWFTDAIKHQLSGPVLVGDYIYGVNASKGHPGLLYCGDPADGSVRWTKEGFGTGSVIAVGDKLLVLGEEGHLVLVAVDSKKYVELARAKILTGHCWNNPALAGGRLFAKNDGGHLVCVQLAQ